MRLLKKGGINSRRGNMIRVKTIIEGGAADLDANLQIGELISH